MRRAVSLVLALAASSCGMHFAAPPPRTPPKPSPVVVAIVVDQLSAWVLEERAPKLPADGFFARMRREGTWAQHMRYSYALTDTAPGHAALHTGKAPYESRILVNHNLDEQTGARKSFFRDPTTKMVLPDGVTEEPGSSARVLAAETVADRLRAHDSRSKILSFSLKDRAALLPAGRKPTHAIWFEAAQGAFGTSTAIEPALPAWAVALGSVEAITKARSEEWTPLDRAWLEQNAETKDEAPGEGDLEGLGTTFPHRTPNSWAFRATPMADRVLLDLALAGAKAEDDPNVPLLLLISLSSSDVLGHTFGPSSWEAWDHLRRLDAALADFLRKLEAQEGRPVSVLLSGDHGNVTMPEARRGCEEGRAADPYDRPCVGGGRILPDQLRTELRAELGDAIAGVSDGYVFLTAAARALEEPKRGAIDAGVRRVLEEKHARDVAEIYDVRDLAKRCPAALASQRGVPARALPGEDVLVLVCRSWAPNGGAGDYYVLPAHGSFFDGEIVPGKGTSHGTPYLYDRTVPLLVRGDGVEAGKVITEPVDFTAYSKLEASLLRIDTRPPAAILSDLTARP